MKLTAGVAILVLTLGISASAQEEKPKSKKIDVAFYGSVAALCAATAVDIRSGSRLDPNRFYESRPAGSALGQIATTAISTGGAFIIHRFGRGRARWIATALLVGAAAGHAYAAHHNYALRSTSAR
jgi:hypothetical protein